MFSAARLPNPKGFEPSFLYSLEKYYRIWFSDKPEVFLGTENELRFIRMREANPAAQLYFIYSGRCLSAAAFARMNDFCQTHRITPINFDDQVRGLLTDPLDIKMYELAEAEITACIKPDEKYHHGNLAAAADCTRLLVPVIENYGIYSDYDVTLHLSDLKQTLFEIKAPLLLNAEVKFFEGGMALPHINSDFIAFAVDRYNQSKICKEALIAVRQIQDEIISNYTKPVTFTTFCRDQSVLNKLNIPGAKQAFAMFSKLYQQDPSVFNFRKFASTVTIPGLSQLENKLLQVYLYKGSVISVSGPGVYTAMYKQLLPKGHDYCPVMIPSQKNEWHNYFGMYRKSSLGEYDALYDCVDTTNTLTASNKTVNVKTGDLCDSSWTSEGVAAKAKREEKMVRAATCISRLWRNGMSIHAKLLSKAKSCASPQYLQDLRDKKYSLVLRKASNDLNLDLIKLLLELKGRGVGFDINGLSSSKPYTALDWAENAVTKHPKIKKEVIKSLKDAGAKSAVEIDSVKTEKNKLI